MKERLVTCNEEDTDGRARLTRDEERLNFEAGFGSVTSTIIFEILHCCRLCNLRLSAC